MSDNTPTPDVTAPANAASPQPALRVRGLVVRYGTHTVLDGVDATVEPGEIRVILGGSGSGKSTLLRGMLGLAPVVAGTVEMLGENVNELDDAGRQAVMRRTGVLFQNGALFGSLTVAENIALPLREHRDLPEGTIRELVRMKLAQVSLSHAEHRYPAELSGGMRKRAALARALALDPPLLFCDEPSAGLDPVTSTELDQLILLLRDRLRMTVVVVTHELASIEAIADSLIMVGGGKVIAEGPMAQVRGAGIKAVDDFFARRSHTATADDRTVSALFNPSRVQPGRAASVEGG